MLLTLDISNYKLCEIKESKFEISKVYTIRLQRYRVRRFKYVAKTQFLCDYYKKYVGIYVLCII